MYATRLISPALSSLRVAFLLAASMTAPCVFAESQPVALRCENLDDPLGLSEARPRLSWEMQSNERAQRQTAWRILVASSRDALDQDTGNLWDSSQVAGDDTFGIEYQGSPLHSNEHCYWKIELWDRDGNTSGWSKPASWSMGLLNPDEWKAQWIGYDAPRQAITAAASGCVHQHSRLSQRATALDLFHLQAGQTRHPVRHCARVASTFTSTEGTSTIHFLTRAGPIIPAAPITAPMT